MRSKLQDVAKQAQEQMRGIGSVRVSASDDPGVCPLCGGSMVVQKTKARSGRTLAHGTFEAKETVYVCSKKCCWPSGTQVVRRASRLSEALPPDSNVGYDVMVFIGIERFLHRRQREDIQSALLDRGVRISTGEVSNQARKFIAYMARLQHACAGKIKLVLEGDGGWPLHVDATGEAGRGTILVVIAGWREWVLGSWKISTERADLILPCLQETIRYFGPPCAAMRDMGKAMIPALDALVSEQELKFPVLTCHQHFLADVGKDLLDTAHSELRALFRRTKVRPKLRALIRDLGRRLGTDIEDAREAVIQWQLQANSDHPFAPGLDGLATVRALAQWTLDFKADASGLDFPFDRPYLDLYNRAVKALRATETFLLAPQDKRVTRALKRLHRALNPVDSDVPFQQIAKRIRSRAILFDELRGVLRLAATLPEKETAKELEQIRNRLDEWGASLKKRRPSRGPASDMREAIDLILQHIKTHGDSLFGHAISLPENAGGGIRLVSRTNYLSENFFGALKHDERRRSGYKNLGYVLEHLPAEAALVRNLKHDDYVTTVCGSLDRLPLAFAELDRKEHENKLNDISVQNEQDDELEASLRIAGASLCAADRRVVRTKEMNQCIAHAARQKRAKYNS